jgi:hypothetical protein
VVTAALLPNVLSCPPARWNRFLGESSNHQEVEHLLRSELKNAFGNSDGVFQDMNVKAIFKGVTYELLNDPKFMGVAGQAIPLLDALHDEFEAAKAEKQTDKSDSQS